MAKILDCITPKLQKFIEKQPIFFIGTAAETGNVSVSPKGMDSLRVVENNKVIWLNMTGSGNETAAHLLQNDRMTMMFCAFEGKPLILRLYGNAKIYHKRDPEFAQFTPLFPTYTGARQIIEVSINKVQTSCGFAVPLMDFKQERTLLSDWSDKQGEDKIEAYWENKNTKSIDGFETHILEA